MLSVKKLQDVMESMLFDGIDGVCLMTTEGSLLCSAVTKEESKGTLLAALSSSIYQTYLQGNTEVNFQIINFEHGTMALTSTGKDRYLLAAYGENVAVGLLRGRLLAMSQYFNNIFDQSG